MQARRWRRAEERGKRVMRRRVEGHILVSRSWLTYCTSLCFLGTMIPTLWTGSHICS